MSASTEGNLMNNFHSNTSTDEEVKHENIRPWLEALGAFEPRRDKTIQLRVSSDWLAKVDAFVQLANDNDIPLTRSDVLRLGTEAFLEGAVSSAPPVGAAHRS